jgi:hypothetical protein
MRRVLPRGRAGLLALPAAAALLVFPAQAGAHGLVQRSNLPIPEWLFGWAAAAVLVVSFAALALLWPRPRLEETPWRALPKWIGAACWRNSMRLCATMGS